MSMNGIRDFKGWIIHLITQTIPLRNSYYAHHHQMRYSQLAVLAKLPNRPERLPEDSRKWGFSSLLLPSYSLSEQNALPGTNIGKDFPREHQNPKRMEDGEKGRRGQEKITTWLWRTGAVLVSDSILLPKTPKYHSLCYIVHKTQ